MIQKDKIYFKNISQKKVNAEVGCFFFLNKTIPIKIYKYKKLNKLFILTHFNSYRVNVICIEMQVFMSENRIIYSDVMYEIKLL